LSYPQSEKAQEKVCKRFNADFFQESIQFKDMLFDRAERGASRPSPCLFFPGPLADAQQYEALKEQYSISGRVYQASRQAARAGFFAFW
jgi:hypothetical protein